MEIQTKTWKLKLKHGDNTVVLTETLFQFCAHGV